MEETALLVDVEHLEGLEHLGELTGGNVGIDIEQLAVLGLGERSQDGQRARSDGGLNRVLVDARNLADEAVLVLVEVVGREDAGGDGSSSSAELLESGDELEILLEENSLKGGANAGSTVSPSSKTYKSDSVGDELLTRAILSVLASVRQKRKCGWGQPCRKDRKLGRGQLTSDSDTVLVVRNDTLLLKNLVAV